MQTWYEDVYYKIQTCKCITHAHVKDYDTSKVFYLQTLTIVTFVCSCKSVRWCDVRLIQVNVQTLSTVNYQPSQSIRQRSKHRSVP